MVAYTSNQLEWPGGSTINSLLINFLNNIANDGDSLHLNGQVGGEYVPFAFNVAANVKVQWPNNFTLTAETGCGIDFINTSATISDEFFIGGTNIVIDNLLFEASDAPETGFQGNNPGPPSEGNSDAGTMWNMGNKSPTIRSTTFRNNVGAFLELGGANALDMRNSYMHRSRGAIGLIFGSTNVYLYQCLFDDALIDAIKTVNGGSWNNGYNTGWHIDDCIFQGSRDAIDLTGGLKDSLIENTIFRDLNVCAFDAKFVGYDWMNTANGAAYDHAVCRDFDITNCRCIDTPSLLVLSNVNTDPITYNYAWQEAIVPQRIRMINCEFERTTATDPAFGHRVILDKQGHNCTATGLIRRGWGANDSNIDTVDNAGAEQAGWQSHHNTVTTSGAILARRAYDDSVHFVYGQGGVVPEDPEEPEIPAAPTSAGPAISIHPTTGVLTIDRDRIPALDGKVLTVKVTTGNGSAQAPAEINAS